jgi:hypothetical protein
MFLRIILFSTLALISAGTAMAQEPGAEFWRKVGCQPLEARTNLERFEQLSEGVVIKGVTRIETTDVRKLEVEAVELHLLGYAPSPNNAVKGIAIVYLDQNRALIDYDKIDQLLKAIDALSRVDETSTKLVSFQARYRTVGDLEITVFRQTRSGTAVKVEIGICNPATVYLTLDDLAKLRAMIKEAKTRLDEIG